MSKKETYEEFLEKFKPKLTTDDCFTPLAIYWAVLEWVRKEYKLPDCTPIVRPFWPGGDYESYVYPEGCVVVDNPPFSILTKIATYYRERGIKYFLFAPGLVTFSGYLKTGACAVCVAADIEYENGAIVRTSFLTNLETKYAARSAPDLFSKIKNVVEEMRRKKKADLPKYIYPQEVMTASDINQLSRYGIEFNVSHKDVQFVRALDKQKEDGKAIFGAGFLLSEKAAAEKAAAHVLELSDRERAIIALLGQ